MKQWWQQDRKMTLVLNDGGKGCSDDSRNIGEGGREKTEDNSKRKTRMERMREGERNRDGEGCRQA